MKFHCVDFNPSHGLPRQRYELIATIHEQWTSFSSKINFFHCMHYILRFNESSLHFLYNNQNILRQASDKICFRFSKKNRSKLSSVSPLQLPSDIFRPAPEKKFVKRGQVPVGISNLIMASTFDKDGCCCSAYLSSCHRTASDVNYWTIRTLFIAMTTS